MLMGNAHKLIVLTTSISMLILAAESKNEATLVKKPTPSVLITTNHTFSASDEAWHEKVKHLKAVKIEEGCGRMQNRLVTFHDGTKACARYRLNANLMQGEIYSYIIGKLLGIPNLAPLALTLPDLKDDHWSRVAQAILDAKWQSSKLLILTKYIPDTQDVLLPKKLRTMASNSISPGDVTPDNVNTLAQWSDMIVFDYIIGNMDRLVNTLHNQQWNSNIMEMPVHNLAQKSNSLIFFDNEDGLFHGYSILDRYSSYHEQSLKAICIFRKSTAAAINNLLKLPSLIDSINQAALETDPRILKYLPKLSSKTTTTLHRRLSNVAEHIDTCIKQYSQ